MGCSPWGREESDATEQLHFHALEKEMATHSSVLAWRIPGIGEPGRLLSMGSLRVGHSQNDLAATAAAVMAWGQAAGLSRPSVNLYENTFQVKRPSFLSVSVAKHLSQL